MTLKKNTQSLAMLNGYILECDITNDRGLSYGDGFFATVLLSKGRLVLWDYHSQRLHDSAVRFAIDIDIKSLESDIEFLLKMLSPEQRANGILKIVLTRADIGSRGYRSQSAISNRYITWFPAPIWPLKFRDKGVRLHLCNHRLASQPALAGIKHLNRLDQVIASREFFPDNADEGLLLDQQQYVIEGISSNLFLMKNGRFFTPKLDSAGVDGVMRKWLVKDIIPKLGHEIKTKEISIEEVLNADEVFICNSIMGIRPVRQLGVASIAMGNVTRSLMLEVDKQGYAGLYA